MGRIVDLFDEDSASISYEGCVDGYALVGQDAVVALIEIDGMQFTGEAKRHPDDAFDPEIGETLAFGRALEVAGLYFQAVAENALDAKRGEN